jgi:hypothetical protein
MNEQFDPHHLFGWSRRLWIVVIILGEIFFQGLLILFLLAAIHEHITPMIIGTPVAMIAVIICGFLSWPRE